jgi:hypothetical protein
VAKINLLVYWILTTAIGGAIVYPTVFAIGGAALDGLFESVFPAFIFFGAPVAGAFAGAVVGFCQWLALRKWVAGSFVWPLVSIISWSAGLSLIFAAFVWLVPDGISYVSMVAPFLVGGIMAGLIQWWIIRRWMTSDFWWVVATTAGWILGWIMSLGLASVFGEALRFPLGVNLSIMGAIHGAFIGLESGATLIFLLELSPRTKEIEAATTI